MRKSFWIIFLIILLLNLELFTMGQQKSIDEDYQARMRKEWLKKVPLPKDAVELELKFSFPSEDLMNKDIYLQGAWHVSSDSAGNIYVLDSTAHRVLKFDSSGNYLRQIGRKGQGPGEFDYGPFSIVFLNNFLIISDSGRLHVFDGNGEYVRSLRVAKIYQDMVINDDGLIYAAPISYGEQSQLIDVLTQEGELLYSFGKLKKFKYGQSQLNHVKLALNRYGELFAAFEHFPVVRKYSTDGELLIEFRIEHKAIETQEEINQERISSQKRGVGYVIIISAIKASRDRIYILHTVPRIKILEFSNNGKQKSIYWYVRPYEYPVRDFLVRNRGKEKLFYFLQTSPENKIEVFSPKQK
jgi:hypothetical protein